MAGLTYLGWVTDSRDVQESIAAGIRRYTERFGDKPQSVRVHSKTLGGKVVEGVMGARVMVDDTVQPGMLALVIREAGE